MPDSTRKLIQGTLESARAVTFVDILAILRSIRGCGLTTRHFQDSLVQLLDHPLATKRSVDILEKAVTAELKNHEREFLRGQQTLRMHQHRQRVRGACGQELRIELATSYGTYWEPAPEVPGFRVTLALGESARPGHDCFIVNLKQPGRHRAVWTRKRDARLTSNDSLRKGEVAEFFIELLIEHQP